MVYKLKPEETEKIISHYGNDYYDKVKLALEIYSKKWDLKILNLIDYYSVNCLFICNSEKFGKVILKIGRTKEILTEYKELLEYNGKIFVAVYLSDIENGIFLEKFVLGKMLREDYLRIRVFLSFFYSEATASDRMTTIIPIIKFSKGSSGKNSIKNIPAQPIITHWATYMEVTFLLHLESRFSATLRAFIPDSAYNTLIQVKQIPPTRIYWMKS